MRGKGSGSTIGKGAGFRRGRGAESWLIIGSDSIGGKGAADYTRGIGSGSERGKGAADYTRGIGSGSASLSNYSSGGRILQRASVRS